MRAWKHTDLTRDLTDVFQTTSVGAFALIEDLATHGRLLDAAQDLADVLRVLGVLLVLFGERRDDVFGHRGHRLIPLLLVTEVEGLSHLGGSHTFDLFLQVGIGCGRRPLHVRHAMAFEKLVLERAQLFDACMRDPERFENLTLRHLESAALDHRDRFRGARYDDVDVGVLELLEGRVQHPGVLDAAHSDRGHRRVERDLRHVERHRGTQHGEHVGIVFLVRGQNEAGDLRLVSEPLRKQGPDGPIDAARGENLLLARPPFALEEAAGDLARSVRLLAILDGEGEKWEVGWPVLHCGRNQHHRIAVLHEARALREFGHTADFERQCPSCELALHPLNHVVLLTSVSAGEHPQPRIECRVAVGPEERATAARGTRAPTQKAWVA